MRIHQAVPDGKTLTVSHPTGRRLLRFVGPCEAAAVVADGATTDLADTPPAPKPETKAQRDQRDAAAELRRSDREMARMIEAIIDASGLAVSPETRTLLDRRKELRAKLTPETGSIGDVE